MRLLSRTSYVKGPLLRPLRILFVHILLLTLCLADTNQSQDVSSGCSSTEFKCHCGIPKCIDKSLVKNGVKDCQNGEDEGERWDPSKCEIKNRTSEDIRFKRGAIPDSIAKDATTTFFSHDRARTRPVGLLSTNLGAFVTSGTTTEYLTKVLGTYIKGTYARIIQTSSKVYHAVASDAIDSHRPTGFIASTTSTEVNGYATTVHTTDFYRTYIDGTYAQLVSSSSDVKYPSWYTDKIEPSDSAAIEPTLASVASPYHVYRTGLPQEIRGSFLNNVVQSKAYAELGIVAEEELAKREGKVKALRPNNNAEHELKVTGTHGKFVHSDKTKGDETTYNVFTGRYVQNSKTFLFFFGNTVIDATKSAAALGSPKPTLLVESGSQGSNNIQVNMASSLRVLVPSSNNRINVDGSVRGEQMPGVLVEIEGSEGDSGDFISVDGGRQIMETPSIDMMTVTLENGHSVSSSSSSSQSSQSENEIPQGRKVPDPIAPSSAQGQRGLPTFTVGQPDIIEFETEVTTPKAESQTKSSETSSKSRSSSNGIGGAPVFQKTTEAPLPKSTERIRALGYTAKKSGASNLNGRYPMPNRAHRAFSMLDSAEKMKEKNNEVESDLESAESKGRATVTYVGFADFTTTVGNTVIVFMPRTKMIEDLSVHASKSHPTPSSTVQKIEPTRYVYTTTESEFETTTEKVEKKEKPKIRFSESVSGKETVFIGDKSSSVSEFPKVKASSSSSSSLRPKFIPKSSASGPVFSSSKTSKNKPSVYQTANTMVFQTDVLNPTGLVTSVDGTIVRDEKTTLYTSLVFGTFIGSSYAQVIKSTSRVVKASEIASSSAVKPSIRPTHIAKLPSYSSSSKTTAPVFYEFSTTSSSDGEDERTTTPNVMEVTVSSSSTTARSNKEQYDEDDDEDSTTVDPKDLDDNNDQDDIEVTTTTEREAIEAENEVERKRKVSGKAKDQIIVDLEPSRVDGDKDEQNNEDEEQTVYVTRTLPTTVYRTYTYYTTFFIPEDGSTSTKVVSREVTSSAVGLVRKTLTSVIPTASNVEPEVKASAKPVRSRGFGRERGSQVIYKTLFTTYTYLTTFFSGQTSSVSSREETVSNVITVTSSASSSTPSSAIQITPTASVRSRGFKSSVVPSLSSPSASSSSAVGSKSRSSIFRRPKLSSIQPSVEEKSSLSASPVPEEVKATSEDELEYQSVTKTLLRTFMTTYTYFTTLFNGEDTSIKSRTEVITNVVPYVTKTLAPIQEEEEPKAKGKETTFYTTYTYLSTIFKGKSSKVKTSKQTYTNIVVEDSTLRSGYISDAKIIPTQLSGRSVGGANEKTAINSLEEDSTDKSEYEEDITTFRPLPKDYEHELEGSEDVGITTNRPNNDDEDNEDQDVPTNEKTPLLRTLYTTYTFYTTFYKGGSSTVSSRLETKSQVVTDSRGIADAEVEDVTVTDKAPLLSTIEPSYPVTYFTTYTYWTTSFKDGASVVTSREETVTNVVTPDNDSPSSPTSSSVAVKETDSNEILPSASAQEVELTTFYTTYTYFTTSYLGEKTVINSRLETVTNVVTGTPSLVSPTQTGRAIGTIKPADQKITGHDKDEYEDYATGLLSTIVSSEVKDGTTTLFSTDVFGTLIDGIYAQVLESTSQVINPTVAAFTRFFPEASESVTGVVSVNEGKTVEAGKDRTTYYATTAYGTVIDGQYAHLVESSSSIKASKKYQIEPSDEPEALQKTGLVRVIDGTLVEGDKTTFYTSSILGTLIDGQYAQVIESTSRYVIAPTKSIESGPKATSVVEVESSVTESSSYDEEGVTTTTEKSSSEEVTEKAKKGGIFQPKRPGFGRGNGSSRLSFTGSAKTFTPTITPFASRSRPSGFVPRRRTSSSIVVSPTKTVDEGTVSSSSTRGFQQGKRRFQKPSSEATSSESTPTPALPASRTRGGSRFSKPPVGIKSKFEKTSSSLISPSSASTSGGGSSPGARGRSSFIPRGSSVSGGRGRSSASVLGSSSSSGFVRPSTSRFSPGNRGRSSFIQPSATSQTSTVSPTASSTNSENNGEDEYVEGPSSQATTEAPRTTSRYGGGSNRFRLSPKLSTPTAGSASSSQSTTSRPNTTRGSPLNLRRFSKPTIPTRGTTPSAESSSSSTESSSSSEPSSTTEEYEYEEVSSSTTPTTSKPLRPGFGGRKPIVTRPTSRPVSSVPSRNRATTTTSPVAQSTTRRTYTPRPRPSGFPKAVGPLARSTTTTSTTPIPDEEYYEEGEFEYQESKNLPSSNASAILTPAASELSEVKVLPSDGKKSMDELFGENSAFLDSLLKSFPQEGDEVKRRKRSTRQDISYYLTPNNNNNYGARTARGTLRSNFPTRSSPPASYSSSNLNSKPNSRVVSGLDYEYVYEYETDDQPAPLPPPPPTTTSAPSRQSSRFRGRIQPTPSQPTSRRTPFTLTPNSNSRPLSSSSPSRSRGSSSPSSSRSSSSNSNGINSSPSRPFIPTRGRSQSRYQRPDPVTTTTSRSSRFRSRYNSGRENTTPSPISSRGSSSSRFGSSLGSRGRGSSNSVNNANYNNHHAEPVFEASTITVTHYVPAMTQIPYFNGKSTEFKTVVTPSPSIQILSPFQYTQSEYLGKDVFVLNSESTATPSIGVTEITRFIIRESPTTSVTFTPTTIRGRKTSFSHIVPSTVYSVEPLVSTVTGLVANPLLQDSNQLTNLLLNQLLGQGLLNPANLLALQGQGFPTNANPLEPATPITQYNTKTTSYVTTVTDFTSTIVKITLHGKPLKSTIVESSTHIITATEFITESTVITPTQPLVVQPQLNTALVQQQPNNNLLLQNLLQLQQQQQQLLAQQSILSTPSVALLLASQTVTQSPAEKEQFNQEEESVQKDKTAKSPPKQQPASSSVVTLYVSGKNPGEFSTVLQTVAVSSSSSDNRKKRSVQLELGPTNTLTMQTYETQKANFVASDILNDSYYNNIILTPGIELEDSYSYSDHNVGASATRHSDMATDSLDSYLLLPSLSHLP